MAYIYIVIVIALRVLSDINEANAKKHPTTQGLISGDSWNSNHFTDELQKLSKLFSVELATDGLRTLGCRVVLAAHFDLHSRLLAGGVLL
jgi:hypothetical protein